MVVRDTLKAEMDVLIKDLIGKIDVPKDQTSIRINDVFDLATKCGAFDQKAYVFSNDDDVLTDVLNFSLAISKLWRTHKQTNPEATYQDVNYLIIEYMKHMWGLDEVPTMQAGDLSDREA